MSLFFLGEFMQIYLIGFMGCGKSYLGKQLAKYLELDFYDLDQIIETETGMSILDIFETQGETYFRDIESKVLAEFNSSGIISTGGGIIERAENRMILGSRLSIWLDVSFDILYDRIISSDRPLVKSLGKNGLYKLYISRYSMYQMSSKECFRSDDLDECLCDIQVWINEIK